MAKNNNYDVAKAFQDIESVLISSMTRNMQLHLDEQEALGYNWSQWQAEMLKGLDEYKKRNSKLLNGYTRKIDNQIDYAIKQAYLLGNSEQEIKILKALKRGYKCKIPKNVKKDLKGKNFKASLDDLIKLKESNGIEGAFFKVNDRKLNALIKATKNDFKKAEKAILRRTDDIYRQVIFSAQVYANTGAGTTWQAVDMATKQFLEKGIDCVQYKNGSQVNIASYAEMAIRTASKKAYLTGEGAKRKEWGIHTVIINSHNSACPLCIPFQNKVFIDNVYSGGTKQEAKETGYPSLSDAIAQGLFHPNCKDTSSTYFEGITNIPNKVVGEKEQLRRYNLEQKQRYMERQMRKYKRLEKGALDEENKEMYADKVAEWQQKNAWFIEENRDILRRDYAREKYRGVAPGDIPTIKIEKPKPTVTDHSWKNEKFTPTNFKNKKETSKYLKDKFNINFSDSRKYPLDEEIFSEMVNFIDKFTSVYKDFDELNPSKLPIIDIKPASQMKGKMGCFVYYINGAVDSLALNGKYHTDKNIINDYFTRVKARKWTVANATQCKTFVHEYGHYVSHSMIQIKNSNWQDEFIDGCLEEYNKRNKTEYKYYNVKEIVGEYAQSSKSELFAEAFAEYFGGENPREFAKIFGERLEKELRGVKKNVGNA